MIVKGNEVYPSPTAAEAETALDNMLADQLTEERTQKLQYKELLSQKTAENAHAQQVVQQAVQSAAAASTEAAEARQHVEHLQNMTNVIVNEAAKTIQDVQQ